MRSIRAAVIQFDYRYLLVVEHAYYGVPHLVHATEEDVRDGGLDLPLLHPCGVELRGVGRDARLLDVFVPAAYFRMVLPVRAPALRYDDAYRLVAPAGVLQEAHVTVRGQILVEPRVRRAVLRRPDYVVGALGVVGAHLVLPAPQPELPPGRWLVAQRDRVNGQHDAAFRFPPGAGVLHLFNELRLFLGRGAVLRYVPRLLERKPEPAGHP